VHTFVFLNPVPVDTHNHIMISSHEDKLFWWSLPACEQWSGWPLVTEWKENIKKSQQPLKGLLERSQGINSLAQWARYMILTTPIHNEVVRWACTIWHLLFTVAYTCYAYKSVLSCKGRVWYLKFSRWWVAKFLPFGCGSR